MSKIYLKEIEDYGNTLNLIRNKLHDYVKNNNIKSLVMGISGGIDSALCAAIAKPVCDELKIPLIGRSISIESNKKSEIDRADAIGHYFCTNFKERDLTDKFHTLSSINAFDEGNIGVNWNDKIGHKIRLGNIKARIRMIYLYHLASESKGMVLSTDNLTEYLLGFSTIMGDWGDYGMIQNLWKTEVYNLSEWIAKNELDKDSAEALMNCVNANATDGLGISNTDLNQILPEWNGTSREGYSKVDYILKSYLDKKLYEDNIVIKRHNNTHFKRNWPINIKRTDLL